MGKRTDIKKILLIGSGPIVIGQAAEFDYSGSQACRTLKSEGYEVVLINSNPATIQTDPSFADRVYIEPTTPEIVEKIIEKEKPDALLATMGGQTGLNVAVALHERGVLEKHGVKIIGTPIEAITQGEDRELFASLMKKIGEPIPKSAIATTLYDAQQAAETIGYPVVIRPAYTLGGTGGGIANNPIELQQIVEQGLLQSPEHQVLIEKCLTGWYEFEYEVMRDNADNCITICSMENVDPMGIHTGESVVVAPAQTLSDAQHQQLRSAALKIIRALGVVGGCNIQFAVNPKTWEYAVIEVNPRVSRSSALASKATGYPIAKIATKLSIGWRLDEIKNDITQTSAAFEPALDYVVVKIPRWPFDKFRYLDKRLGTQMKSTGEVMAIGRTFEEALQKAIRSLEVKREGITDAKKESSSTLKKIKERLKIATHKRLFYIYAAFRNGLDVDEIAELTGINRFFLQKIKHIYDVEQQLMYKPTPSMVKDALKLGFSREQLKSLGVSEEMMQWQHHAKERKVYKMVDTCAGEFTAHTPYFYSTTGISNDASCQKQKKKIAVIGGGPIRIGQGIEFDYCCVHGVLAAREMGFETVMINNNPETVSTDYDVSDRLFFEPLTGEDVIDVLKNEGVDGVIVQFGGQTSINLAKTVENAGFKVLGTPTKSIDLVEDRDKCARLLSNLGIRQAEFGIAHCLVEAQEVANKIGYPVLVRPSYVLGGRAMQIVHNDEELRDYIHEATKVAGEHPILIDKFLENAVELDVDAVCDGEDVLIAGIMEHIEEAGVHSGDSACVLPTQHISEEHIRVIKEWTKKIALEIGVVGLLNVQFAIHDSQVYVLEINPRASRTVPFVSKSTGIPLAKIGTMVMLGKKLKDLNIRQARLDYVSVKVPVFPFSKLGGVDPVLGPEMKSTGEVMAMGKTFAEAFYKALIAAGMRLPTKGNVFISVKKSDRKQSVVIAKKFKELGFNIYATPGTGAYLREHGLDVEIVNKVSAGTPNILDLMKKNKIDLIINTPTTGLRPTTDGYLIRRKAVELNIPYITVLTTANVCVDALKQVKRSDLDVVCLSDLEHS